MQQSSAGTPMTPFNPLAVYPFTNSLLSLCLLLAYPLTNAPLRFSACCLPMHHWTSVCCLHNVNQCPIEILCRLLVHQCPIQVLTTKRQQVQCAIGFRGTLYRRRTACLPCGKFVLSHIFLPLSFIMHGNHIYNLYMEHRKSNWSIILLIRILQRNLWIAE